jgi:pyrroline-5-carboxylate reductase
MEGKVGFIGFGSMGGVLLRSLLRYGSLIEQEVIVSTRSREKLSGFISKYPGLEVMQSNTELAERCHTVFICVGTNEVKGVIEEINPSLAEDAHLVYISSGLTISNVAKIYDGKISKVIPSLTCGTRNCVILVHHNEKVTEDNSMRLERCLSKIGTVKIIAEDQFEIGADITSCAPAFMAAMMKHFTAAAVKNSVFSEEEALAMVRTTMLGTATLLSKRKIPFDSLIDRVATNGGITGDGVNVLDEKLPAVFDELFAVTLAKNDAVKAGMDEQYGS